MTSCATTSSGGACLAASDRTLDILEERWREPLQCERMCRVFSFALYRWCSYTLPGSGSDSVLPRRDHLTAIPFDKLVMLVASLWDGVYEQDWAKLASLGGSLNAANVQPFVRFLCPFPELPGLHGPGRAIYRKPDPKFITELVYHLEHEHILPYFSVQPPSDDPKNPRDPRTTVCWGIPLTEADQDIGPPDFTLGEKTLIVSIANAVAPLSQDEIRALGTHDKPGKTLLWIKKEFEYIAEKLPFLEEGIRSDEHFEAHAAGIHECVTEALLKSNHNRALYVAGRRSMQTRLDNSQLKTVFMDSHSEPAHIWDQREILWLKERAESREPLSRYLRDFASLHRQPAKIASTRHVSQVRIPNLPEKVTDAFEAPHGGIKSDVKNLLLKEIVTVFHS